MGQVHDESCLAQALAQIFTRFGLIFHNQYLHDGAPLAGVVIV
jgi:hypothetical protein